MSTRPTLISRKAGNWVDLGEPSLPKIRIILAHFYDWHEDADVTHLEEVAATVTAMVAADATDIQVASYLRSVARSGGSDSIVPPNARLTAVAIWHVAKAALTRDAAERVLRSDLVAPAPNPGPLGHCLAARLLTPAELAACEAEGAREDDPYVRPRQEGR